MPDQLPLILVCDDTPAKRYIIASWLRRDGFRVVEASTAGEAHQVLRDEAIDLAVLDVHLPDGNGFDITRQMREDPRLSSMPVVHVSAIAVDTSDRVAGLDHGADAYLIDPIDPDEFLSTIRALLRSSGARRSAEELSEKMTRLNSAALRLNVAATVSRLAEALAGAVAELLEEPAVVLVDDGEVSRRAAAAPGGAVDASDTVERPADGLLVAGSGNTTVVVTDAPWNAVLPPSVPHHWRLSPICSGDETVGLIAVPDSGDPTADYLLEQLAGLAGVAFDNLRALQRERQTALVLQRSLLPAALPDPAGLTIVARYRASERHAEVGGDFYDALELDSGTLVCIGDVEGHSLQAAVVMAELRHSLRAYAYDGYGPGEIADRLDIVLTTSWPRTIATLCLAEIAPDRRSMRVVSAGHPPLMLVRQGEAQTIKPAGALLGLRTTHREEVVTLESGDRIMLFTDGLIERRDEDLYSVINRLGRSVLDLDEPDLQRAADHIVHHFGISDDDVALLMVDVRSG